MAQSGTEGPLSFNLVLYAKAPEHGILHCRFPAPPLADIVENQLAQAVVDNCHPSASGLPDALCKRKPACKRWLVSPRQSVLCTNELGILGAVFTRVVTQKIDRAVSRIGMAGIAGPSLTHHY
jgi:hypothetical protein